MTNYEKIKEDIIKILKEDNSPEYCDLSDVGNLIGIAIGPYINDEMGFDKDAFMHGVKHGISLIDGTH